MSLYRTAVVCVALGWIGLATALILEVISGF